MNSGRRRILLRCNVEERLGCSKSMVLKLLAEGQLEGFKVGVHWRIYEDSVEAYQRKREAEAA